MKTSKLLIFWSGAALMITLVSSNAARSACVISPTVFALYDTLVDNQTATVQLGGYIFTNSNTNLTGFVIFATTSNSTAIPVDGTSYAVGSTTAAGAICIYNGLPASQSYNFYLRYKWGYNSSAQGGTPLTKQKMYYLWGFTYSSTTCYSGWGGHGSPGSQSFLATNIPNMSVSPNPICVSSSTQTITVTLTGSPSNYGLPFANGAPNMYNLRWDAAGITAGLINSPSNAACGSNFNTFATTGGTFDQSTFTYVIPANVAAGTYQGFVDPYNTTTGYDNCLYNGAGMPNEPDFVLTIAGASPNISGQTICGDGSVTFTVTDPGFGYTVEWSTDGISNNDGSGSGGLGDLTKTKAITVGTPVTEYALITNGSCTSSWVPATGTANALPAAPTIIHSADWDSLFVSPATYSSYQWYKNAASMAPGGTSDTLVIGTDTSYYNVIVENGNGCEDSAGVAQSRLLPIELVSFEGIYNGKTVDLSWSTASEINNNFFTVERTKDGLNFTSVIDVKGAGNSSALLNYHAVDEHPLSGVSAYRLKQTDFDGRYQYSDMVAVSIQTKGEIEITGLNSDANQGLVNYLVYSPSGKPFNIEVTDLTGNVMVVMTSPVSAGTIDFSRFAHGVYFFKAINANGSSIKRFIY